MYSPICGMYSPICGMVYIKQSLAAKEYPVVHEITAVGFFFHYLSEFLLCV